MLKQNLHNLFTCPLSVNYISDPVMADDGYVYEFLFIKKHLSENSKSPVTRLAMSGNLIRSAYLFNTMVSYYEENNIIFPLTKIDQVTKIKLVKEHYNDLIKILLNSEKHDLDKVFSDRNVVDFLVANYEKNPKFSLEFFLISYGKKNDFTNFNILVEGVKQNKFDIDAKNSNGCPAILNIISDSSNYNGSEVIKIIKTFAELGVNLESVSYERSKLIHYVCCANLFFGPQEMEEIIDYLIDKVDVTSPGRSGYTPISMIAKIKQNKYDSATLTSIIKKLIERGVDVRYPGSCGYTPLHFVCCSTILNEADRLKIIKMMINAGADLRTKTEKGETPTSLFFSRLDKMNADDKMNFIKVITDNI